jgi:hypothetical protein
MFVNVCVSHVFISNSKIDIVCNIFIFFKLSCIGFLIKFLAYFGCAYLMLNAIFLSFCLLLAFCSFFRYLLAGLLLLIREKIVEENIQNSFGW